MIFFFGLIIADNNSHDVSAQLKNIYDTRPFISVWKTVAHQTWVRWCVFWVNRPFKKMQQRETAKCFFFFFLKCETFKCRALWVSTCLCCQGWCGQLRAVVRGSGADDGDDSAAYWPVTLLSAVIAALTDTDHPHSSGQNTFIILFTFSFFFFFLSSSTPASPPEARKIYTEHAIHTFHF